MNISSETSVSTPKTTPEDYDTNLHRCELRRLSQAVQLFNRPRWCSQYSDYALELDCSGFESWQKASDLSPSPRRPYRLWGPTSLVFKGRRNSFPGVKWPGRELKHSPPCRAVVKNEWSYTSAPPYMSLFLNRHKFVSRLFFF